MHFRIERYRPKVGGIGRSMCGIARLSKRLVPSTETHDSDCNQYSRSWSQLNAVFAAKLQATPNQDTASGTQLAKLVHRDDTMCDNSREQAVQVQTIQPKALYELIHCGEAPELIDVRSVAEFDDKYILGARCIPLHAIQPTTLMVDRTTASAPLYVICQSGSRGREACEKFSDAGYDNVGNVAGGILAWTAAGLPVERGRQGIPLDGQVRIAIGFIVLASALASLLHPYFLFITIFMGCGLIFSGVSGFCGLAILLAKAPWNGNAATITSCETSRAAP